MEPMYLLVALFFVWAGAMLSNKKGRGYWLGAVLGLFGLIGLLIIWVIPAKADAMRGRDWPRVDTNWKPDPRFQRRSGEAEDDRQRSA